MILAEGFGLPRPIVLSGARAKNDLSLGLPRPSKDLTAFGRFRYLLPSYQDHLIPSPAPGRSGRYDVGIIGSAPDVDLKVSNLRITNKFRKCATSRIMGVSQERCHGPRIGGMRFAWKGLASSGTGGKVEGLSVHGCALAWTTALRAGPLLLGDVLPHASELWAGETGRSLLRQGQRCMPGIVASPRRPPGLGSRHLALRGCSPFAIPQSAIRNRALPTVCCLCRACRSAPLQPNSSLPCPG